VGGRDGESAAGVQPAVPLQPLGVEHDEDVVEPVFAGEPGAAGRQQPPEQVVRQPQQIVLPPADRALVDAAERGERALPDAGAPSSLAEQGAPVGGW
jgi:hypothetical protein